MSSLWQINALTLYDIKLHVNAMTQKTNCIDVPRKNEIQLKDFIKPNIEIAKAGNVRERC